MTDESQTVVDKCINSELRGLSCLTLGTLPAQGLRGATRSFSTRIEDFAKLKLTMSAYATRPSEKHRHEGLDMTHKSVTYRTSKHDRGAPPKPDRTAMPGFDHIAKVCRVLAHQTG